MSHVTGCGMRCGELWLWDEMCELCDWWDEMW